MAIPGIAGNPLTAALKKAPDQTTGIAPAPAPFQETWVEQRDREAAQTPKLGQLPTPAPFQETWVEQRDREAAAQPTPTPAPFQETWVEQRDREAAMKPQPTAGMANGGAVGLIPGKVNHGIADDITINAKRGEYLLSVEDVAALGGAEAIYTAIQKLRKEHGIPLETGPKMHGEADSLGRMDKPGLNGTEAERLAIKLVSDQKPKGQTERGMIVQRLTELARRDPVRAGREIAQYRQVGKVSNLQAKQILRNARFSPLEVAFKRLSHGDAQQVFNVATATEKKKLQPMLAQKSLTTG